MVADDRVARSVFVQPAGQLGVEVASPLLGNQPVGGLLQKRVSELLPAVAGGLDQLALGETVELGLRPAAQSAPRPPPPGNHGRPPRRRSTTSASARAVPPDARSEAPGSNAGAHRRRRRRRPAPPGARRRAGCPRRRRRPDRRDRRCRAGLALISRRRVCTSSRRSIAIVIVLVPAPHPGRRSANSGRAVQTHQQGSRAAAAEQLLDDVQQQIVGPVHVLEHDRHRARPTPALRSGATPPRRRRAPPAVRAGLEGRRRPPRRPGRRASARATPPRRCRRPAARRPRDLEQAARATRPCVARH